MKQPMSQLAILKQDKWLAGCLSWIPIVLAMIIWAIFSKGIARDLPIGVVDLSHSKASRSLINHFNASPTMKIAHYYPDTLRAKNALVESEVYAYVVIPKDFDKQLAKQTLPQVTTFYNSQYILIGRLINSAIVQSTGYFNASVETGKQLAKGNQVLDAAMGKAVPIRTQITPLFNSNTNYAQFLVSAIVPAIWQIGIVVGTIMILAANRRAVGDSIQLWLGSKPVYTIGTLLSRYFLVFALQGALFLFFFYVVLAWPQHGNLWIVMLAQWLTIVTCMIMGTLFYLITLDAARAMSFAGAFTAPSFAFMGITFPVTDMGLVAQAWRNLLPISHYIEVQVSQTNYGLTALESLMHLVPMTGYIIPALLIVFIVNKKLRPEVIA
ncbi:ABC-type multidrug transport system permease component [Vibrio astriarenae]|nr:ABC-type multidrug transport system permease component [Vibrio sp. C7]